MCFVHGLSFAMGKVILPFLGLRLACGCRVQGTGFMAFAKGTVRGVTPRGKKRHHAGRAAFLVSLGAVASLGALAGMFTMQRSFHASVSTGSLGVASRPFSVSSMALIAPEGAPRSLKFPRVPELGNQSWQVSTMDEGSVIGLSGEIIVITPPKPKIVVAAKAPLEAEAFGARATGLDLMPVASIAPSYGLSDEPAPSLIDVAALAGAMPPEASDAQGPFDLVLAEPALEGEVPLPGMRPKRPAEAKRAPQMLAYAPQDNPIQDLAPTYQPAPKLVARGRTAIYSIEAATVYMPNGERLEAHSGLGPMLDDPRFVHKKMRGATPPHTYNLTMREALFHGVEAIRLNPVNPAKIFGRDGLLAHTYMLGKRGDSNGCLVFKDYRRFLSAFKRGDITQLVVVARLPGPSTRLASR